MRYREIKSLLEYDGINERCGGEEHDGKSEQVAGAGLDAEKSADTRDEDEDSERRGADSDEIECQQAMPRLDYRRNAREYVDEADNASYLLIFAFCHDFLPSFCAFQISA